VKLAAVAVVIAATAHAHAAPKPKPPPRAWLGTFVATKKLPPCADCEKLTAVGAAGSVVVLAPGDGAAAADGSVVIVSPLLGSVAVGKIVAGRVAVPWFVVDRRAGNDGVLVLTGDARIAIVEPKKPELVAIAKKLQRDDLENVHKAIAGLEIAGVDVDGDGVPDFVVTYGCNAWADGACQSRGQFFLARRGGKWVEIE
jgi:hypothetical protein